MASIAVDTHAVAGRFKHDGFTNDQIDALVEVTREGHTAQVTTLVTG